MRTCGPSPGRETCFGAANGCIHPLIRHGGHLLLLSLRTRRRPPQLQAADASAAIVIGLVRRRHQAGDLRTMGRTPCGEGTLQPPLYRCQKPLAKPSLPRPPLSARSQNRSTARMTLLSWDSSGDARPSRTYSSWYSALLQQHTERHDSVILYSIVRILLVLILFGGMGRHSSM